MHFYYMNFYYMHLYYMHFYYMHCITCIFIMCIYILSILVYASCSMDYVLCIIFYSFHSMHIILSIAFYALLSMHCSLWVVFHALHYMYCILCICIIYFALYALYTMQLVTTNPSVTDGEEGEGKRLPPIERLSQLKNSRYNNILCSHYLLYSPVCTKVSYHPSQYWSLWGHQRMSRMKV